MCCKSIRAEEAKSQHSSPESDQEEVGPSQSPVEFDSEQDIIVEQLNESATALGESPVQKRKLKRSSSYRSQILQKLQQFLKAYNLSMQMSANQLVMQMKSSSS